MDEGDRFSSQCRNELADPCLVYIGRNIGFKHPLVPIFETFSALCTPQMTLPQITIFGSFEGEFRGKVGLHHSKIRVKVALPPRGGRRDSREAN